MSAPTKPEPGTTPPEGPKLSPIEQALAKAREAQRGGQSILGQAAEKAAADEPTTEAPTTEPESEEAPSDAAELSTETEDAGEAKAEDETQPDTDETEPPESADTDAVEEDTATEAVAEETEAEEVEGEEPDPELVVALPPRREGDEDIELVVDNKQTAERLRQLRNGYLAGTEIKAAREEIQNQKTQIEELEVWIGTDPAGFIIQNVPSQVMDDVALSLVMDPEVFERVQEKLSQALEDPQERRVLQAELKASRAAAEKQLRQVYDVRKQAQQEVIVLKESIDKMVPTTDGLSEARRGAIIEALETAAIEVVRKNKIQKIEPDDVPVMLAATLRAHGIDPLAAAQALRQGTDVSKPGARPAAKRKQPTRTELKAASEKRKRAAASTPPGGAAPAARKPLPKGQTLEDRFKLVREKGIGAILGR